MLDTHSGFFQDMFSTPTSDDTEGTSDDHPLCVPKDLCTSQSFTMLCKFMYPRKLGVFPKVLIKELDTWELVLEATTALQMDSARKYILSRLRDDMSNISSNAARLLSIIMRYDETPEELMLECLRTIIYRRRPLSLAEATVLGMDSTMTIMNTRERLRSLFFSDKLYKDIPTSENCYEGDCSKSIYQGIVQTLVEKPPSKPRRSNSDIFDIDIENHACYACCHDWSELVGEFKRDKLDTEIRACLDLLRPAGVVSKPS